jgi:hypothetical protein
MLRIPKKYMTLKISDYEITWKYQNIAVQHFFSKYVELTYNLYYIIDTLYEFYIYLTESR